MQSQIALGNMKINFIRDCNYVCIYVYCMYVSTRIIIDFCMKFEIFCIYVLFKCLGIG